MASEGGLEVALGSNDEEVTKAAAFVEKELALARKCNYFQCDFFYSFVLVVLSTLFLL